MDETKKETEETEAKAPAEPTRKNRAPLMMIGALVVGAAASGAFFLLRPMHKANAANAANTPKAAAAAKPAPEPAKETEGGGEGDVGNIVALPPFIVNLNDDEQVSYLKCTLAVELAGKDWQPILEKRAAPVRHAVILYLSSLALADIRGTKNKEKVLAELTNRISEILGKNAVNRIYLSEFVIQ